MRHKPKKTYLNSYITNKYQRVVIEVLQGVAYITQCPENIRIEIHDYDALEE